LVAVGVLAAVMTLFRMPTVPVAPAPRFKPTVELPVPSNLQANDLASFKDPTPLFLPTEWNSSPPEPGRREPEGAFKGYGPIYAFSDNELQLNLPASIAVPAGPPNALVDNAPGNPLVGMGRTDATVAPLAPRWAFVEIIAAASGRRIWAQGLTAASGVPPPAALREGNWRPLEFLAAVDAAGLVGQLTPVARPEAAAADPFLQLQGESLAMLEHQLASELWVGDRLPPGFYRILVGP
jgi:hypothetical protein